MDEPLTNSAPQEVRENPTSAQPEKKKRGEKLHNWWQKHKPSKRRLIQLYAFLLYNANIKGYITGEIFTGASKFACVPGLNCYSCPGAVGACPLGALQNALASTNARAPYYIFGIIMLYGLILGRTICGFLCPIGLFQELLYKIRTFKIEKSRVTRVLSYLKYVILAVLVVGIPLIFAIDKTAVPGFCKYICPAGTIEGAFMLLINPANNDMYSMLGALFSWKTVVLIVVAMGSVFIYRFFCRFLCPLGAIYGLFNRFSLLGIKVDQSKCIDCGKCIAHCKMDVKKVGDHECINCGACMGCCPTNAISWKCGSLFEPKAEQSVVEVSSSFETPATTEKTVPLKKRKDKAFWMRTTCAVLAVLLLASVMTYANFFAVAAENKEATYLLVVNNANDESGIVSFKIGESDEYVMPSSGEGTKESPYVLTNLEGLYDVSIDSTKANQYFSFTTDKALELKLTANEDLRLEIFYVLVGKEYALYNNKNDGDIIKLDLKIPEGFGNTVGFTCYDFTLEGYNGLESVTLSQLRGKVVVINFWATWCGPCVNELPEFEKVCNEYSNVEVVAIHSANITVDVQPFIGSEDKKAGSWSDWKVMFVQDTGTAAKSEIYDLLGGRNGAYPRTLIVDAEGKITAVFEGSITESMLTSAVVAAGAH